MTQAKRNTISALGGMPVRDTSDAMRGLATGNREGKPAEREQVVETNDDLIALCLAVNEIALDPCSCEGSTIPAREKWIGTQVQKVDAKGRPKFTKAGEPALTWTGRGLVDPWYKGADGLTYVNEPYVDEEEWLAKAIAEAQRGCEIILLGPVRPHREWYRDAWCADAPGACDVACWLKPYKFKGYAQTFPAPLALFYWGTQVLRYCEAFERSKLGRIDHVHERHM